MPHPGFATDAIWMLNTDEAELPRTRTVTDFETYLTNLFDDYLALFSGLQTPDYVSQQIAEVLSNFVDGKSQAARDCLTPFTKIAPAITS